MSSLSSTINPEWSDTTSLEPRSQTAKLAKRVWTGLFRESLNWINFILHPTVVREPGFCLNGKLKKRKTTVPVSDREWVRVLFQLGLFIHTSLIPWCLSWPQHNSLPNHFSRLFRSYLSLSTGRCLHQPGECGVRVHAGPGAGGRRGDQGGWTAGSGADLSLFVLLVHGQRDKLPAETVPGGGLEGQVLGSVSWCAFGIFLGWFGRTRNLLGSLVLCLVQATEHVIIIVDKKNVIKGLHNCSVWPVF